MDVTPTEPSAAPPKPSTSEAPAKEGLPTATWQGEDYHLVEEGKAKILYPKGHQVFYNPIQEYNRDMSVMMLRLFAEDWHFKGTSENGSILERIRYVSPPTLPSGRISLTRFFLLQ